MPAENEKFDKFLQDSLKQYRSVVPNDFARKMLIKLQERQWQSALRKIAWQERLLIAACVSLPVAAAILALIFPGILKTPAQLYDLIYLLAQGILNNMINYWQIWTIYSAVGAFLLYAAYDVLLAEN